MPAGASLTAEVVKAVCGQAPDDSGTCLDRLYGLDADKLALLPSVGTEDNLTNVTASPGQVTQPAVLKNGGWFLELNFGTYGGKNGVGAGTISAAGARMSLGTGAPSAPNVSFGQQGKNQSRALVDSTRANLLVALSAKTDASAGPLLYELQVPRSSHDTFLHYGTTH